METNSFDDQAQAPIEKKRESLAFVLWFLAGIVFCALTLQIFFNGSLHSAFGEKWYSESDYNQMSETLLNTYTTKNEEITKSLESSQYVLEFAIMSYYIKGFADGNKGKGDKYFIQCVKKDNVLGTSIMNHGTNYLKQDILNQIIDSLIPTDTQGEVK
jgi:hypothetical protein